MATLMNGKKWDLAYVQRQEVSALAVEGKVFYHDQNVVEVPPAGERLYMDFRVGELTPNKEQIAPAEFALSMDSHEDVCFSFGVDGSADSFEQDSIFVSAGDVATFDLNVGSPILLYMWSNEDWAEAWNYNDYFSGATQLRLTVKICDGTFGAVVKNGDVHLERIA